MRVTRLAGCRLLGGTQDASPEAIEVMTEVHAPPSVGGHHRRRNRSHRVYSRFASRGQVSADVVNAVIDRFMSPRSGRGRGRRFFHEATIRTGSTRRSFEIEPDGECSYRRWPHQPCAGAPGGAEEPGPAALRVRKRRGRWVEDTALDLLPILLPGADGTKKRARSKYAVRPGGFARPGTEEPRPIH